MPDTENRSYFGPVFQVEDTMTKVKRSAKFAELVTDEKIPLVERRMVKAIHDHLNSSRLTDAKNKLITTFYTSVKQAKEMLEANEIELDLTFCDYYNIINRNNYKDTWRANSKYKQALKKLEERKIIKRIEKSNSKFTYIVNPLIIYFYRNSSCKFADVYIKWNKLNNITIDVDTDPHLKRVYKQRNDRTGKLCVLNPKDHIGAIDKIFLDKNGNPLPF